MLYKLTTTFIIIIHNHVYINELLFYTRVCILFSESFYKLEFRIVVYSTGIQKHEIAYNAYRYKQ